MQIWRGCQSPVKFCRIWRRRIGDGGHIGRIIGRRINGPDTIEIWATKGQIPTRGGADWGEITEIYTSDQRITPNWR
jgi:hypothetical protein